MNKKVIGLLVAGVLAVTVGGVSTIAYAATNVNSVAASEVANGYINVEVPELEDGVYDVNVNLLKSGTESTSMAQDMVDYAELVVENNEASVVIYAKSIKKWGITGHVKTLNVFDGDNKYEAKVLESDKDGNPTVLSFKVPAKGIASDKIKVSMTTDVSVIGISMGKELSADMQIDFSKLN